MSQAPASSSGTSGLVKVTVASGSRRVDLVLPGSVPVAELVPELARSVGLLDAMTVYGGYRLIAQDGRELAGDSGLTVQGIEDGGLLTVAAGVDDEQPRVYDDVVEAMTDIVERDLRPWEPATGRRTALWAAGLLLGLGALALLIQGTTVASVAAALVAAGLLVGAIVLSRAQAEPEAAVAVAWMGCGYGAVAGLMLAPESAGAFFTGLTVACGGAGALVVGLVALVGLGAGRSLVIPPVIVGAIFGAAGLVKHLADVDSRIVMTTTLVLIVMAGSIFPWLALGATGTRVDQLFTVQDITSDPEDIDAFEVGADARIAHEILVAVSATVGLLLVLISPLAVALGLAGTGLAIVCCLVVMLRTRQYRTGSEVLTGLVSGILGLGSIAVTVLLTRPEWRPGAAVVLAVAGAVLLMVTLLPSTPSVRRGRLGDIAETVSLLALLPLLILATGVFAAVRG
jgi:type VII secretion integral membrane protein EccD